MVLGSWGYRPQQSDQALDLNCTVDRAIDREIRQILGEVNIELQIFYKTKYDNNAVNYAWNAVGVVFHNLLKGNMISRDLIERTFDILQIIQYRVKDFSKASGWKRPDLLEDSIERHLEILRVLLQENWRKGVIYAGHNFANDYERYMSPILRKQRAQWKKDAKEAKPVEEDAVGKPFALEVPHFVSRCEL